MQLWSSSKANYCRCYVLALHCGRILRGDLKQSDNKLQKLVI